MSAKPSTLLAIALCLALAGCGRNEDLRMADEKVLCDPATRAAYFIRRGPGDTSFVKRNASLDALCPTTQPKGQSNAK